MSDCCGIIISQPAKKETPNIYTNGYWLEITDNWLLIFIGCSPIWLSFVCMICYYDNMCSIIGVLRHMGQSYSPLLVPLLIYFPALQPQNYPPAIIHVCTCFCHKGRTATYVVMPPYSYPSSPSFFQLKRSESSKLAAINVGCNY